jgi:hypothetical protein
VRPILVVAINEGIEAGLLLQDVGRGRLGRLILQREMHPFEPPVLLRPAGRDPLEMKVHSER